MSPFGVSRKCHAVVGNSVQTHSGLSAKVLASARILYMRAKSILLALKTLMFLENLELGVGTQCSKNLGEISFLPAIYAILMYLTDVRPVKD